MKIKSLLTVVLFFFLSIGGTPSVAQERKLSRIERRADRNFIRQKFDKAMVQYETAIKRERNEESQAALHLKTARLYFMVRDYAHASHHYGQAVELCDNLLSVDDICNYIDALRFQGQTRKAEAICLNNAYKDIYSRYQRYQNTLEGLSMRHSVLEAPGCTVTKLSINTNKSEFWVGNYGNQPFYAMSHSNFNDPSKLFFHRTHYYELHETGKPGTNLQKPPRYYQYFRRIPADLQNGPVTFSPDMSIMVTTVIEYVKSKATVDMVDKNLRPFRTKLLYSQLKNKKRQFAKYLPIFPQEETASYAHPYLFNDGKSLLFTSNKADGYGGFDLYVTHYDELNQKWGDPTNLGPQVNTEGDEIFPVLFKDRLIFSSNALPGFGGYDLYSTFFDVDGVVPGSLNHFPYPVNSVYNDYYMCPLNLRAAYFVSDRGLHSRDDIYYLSTLDDLGVQPSMPYFGLSEANAIKGGQLMLSSMTENVTTQSISLKRFAPEGLLMTLYFDFDSSDLTSESARRLEEFVNDMGEFSFDKLSFEGFADEIGSDNYNLKLSERRAETVVRFLQSHFINTSFQSVGHGRTILTPEEVKEEIGTSSWKESGIDWIQINRRARRVEIYNKR